MAGSGWGAMQVYTVKGIPISFPYEAYECQVDYMRKVVEALESKSNALLESPTGTGKTLCLLCATLGWLKSKESDRKAADQIRAESQPKGEEGASDGNSMHRNQLDWMLQGRSQSHRTIVYTSRTHSQLAKVVQELRNTSYRPRTCILGSRQQMCVHPTVSKLQGSAQNQACRCLVAKQECKAHNAVQKWVGENREAAATQLLDIEDLVKLGQSSKGPCPFYVSRELQADAELVILPYNYLVDPKIRKSMKAFDWSSCVLIFDEAHNLEQVCTDAASFDLPSLKLSHCIGEVQSAIEYVAVAMPRAVTSSITRLSLLPIGPTLSPSRPLSARQHRKLTTSDIACFSVFMWWWWDQFNPGTRCRGRRRAWRACPRTSRRPSRAGAC